MFSAVMLNWVINYANTTLLSKNSFIGNSPSQGRSNRTFCNQKLFTNFQTHSSVFSFLLLATTPCFLVLQVTRLSYTKVRYLEVDFLSFTDPVQSESVQASMHLLLVFLNIKPLLKVVFRYLIIQFTTSMCSSYGDFTGNTGPIGIDKSTFSLIVDTFLYEQNSCASNHTCFLQQVKRIFSLQNRNSFP